MIDWMEFWEGSPAEEDRVRDFGCSDLSVVAVGWVPEPQVETLREADPEPRRCKPEGSNMAGMSRWKLRTRRCAWASADVGLTDVLCQMADRQLRRDPRYRRANDGMTAGGLG